MYQIGLTGGIASGKSTVSRLLSELGALIVDADAIAHTVVTPGQPAWRQIIDYFGDQILFPDGNINRRKLGDIVFNDPEKRKHLEAITHPAIWSQVATEVKLAEAAGYQVIVLDVPLLLETDWNRMVNEVWVVYVDRQTQINRLMVRDSLTQQQAEMRIASQLSLEEKKQRADVVIDNSGSPDSTRRQVENLWERLYCDA
jgi:dephospho-CoA kinase